MERRHFIRATTASLLLPAVVEPWCPPALAALSPTHDDYAFFDERFETARRLASSWSAATAPISVQGDVTAVWTDGLDRAAPERRLQLRGVTTESFRFCLGVLVGEHAHIGLQVSRLDRNLFLWMMRTTPKLKEERRDG